MYVDTIAAILRTDDLVELPQAQMSVLREDLVTGARSARVYANDVSTGMRITLWPNSAVKMEVSLCRLDFNQTKAVAAKLNPKPLEQWKCQRIDYYCDIQVGAALPLYLAALKDMSYAGWSRHPFAGSGIVWKSKGVNGRWVKFYDGMKHGKEGVLRFEVSNYRDSAAYMAKAWFGCPQTVGEMSRPGRAAFVLSHFWSKLGLDVPSFGQHEQELFRLRTVFGSRGAAAAHNVLLLHRKYGSECYSSLNLVSKSTYHKWLSLLRDNGFLSSTESDHLPSLSLSFAQAFDSEVSQNLKTSSATPIMNHQKKFLPENWAELSKLLGLAEKAPENSLLLRSFNAWKQSRFALDSAPGIVQTGDRRGAALGAGAREAAGTGAW